MNDEDDTVVVYDTTNLSKRFITLSELHNIIDIRKVNRSALLSAQEACKADPKKCYE